MNERIPDEIVKSYQRLTAEVDRACTRLFSLHRASLQCRRGCSICCENITLQPVEWYILRSELAAAGRTAELTHFDPKRRDENRCILLRDRACSVYDTRPIICRIHGLPLGYTVEEYDAEGRRLDTSERAVRWCELNFADPPRRETDFSDDELLDVSPIDRALEKLNGDFCEITGMSSHLWLKMNDMGGDLS